VPAAFLLCAAVSLLFYNINDRFLEEIESDLLKRKRVLPSAQ